MAVNTRLSAPNYKIFEPDALDAIYAKGMLDPMQGGIALALSNAHGMDKSVDTQRALDEQAKFNQMARGLDAMEIQQKQKEAALKIGGNLIEHGEDPTNILGSDSIYANPAGSLLPGLLRNKISAETAAALAKAAADKNGMKDTYTVQYEPPGQNKTIIEKRQGRSGQIPEMTIGTGSPAPAAPNPTESTPVPVDTNKPAADAAGYAQRVRAATGTNTPVPQQLPGGKMQYTNPTSGKSVVFDTKTGNQVR